MGIGRCTYILRAFLSTSSTEEVMNVNVDEHNYGRGGDDEGTNIDPDDDDGLDWLGWVGGLKMTSVGGSA